MFVDVYVENRFCSLVYYWMVLIEDLVCDFDFVCEIFVDGFVFNFLIGIISDFEGFKVWLIGLVVVVVVSIYEIIVFDYWEIVEGVFEFFMIFDWNGILLDGMELIVWILYIW